MTIKELSQVYYLKKEIENCEERLKELRSYAYSAGSAGFEGSHHGNSDGDRIIRNIASIIKAEDKLRKKKSKLIQQTIKIESYIDTIQDSITRLIFSYRFLSCMSWVQVSMHIGGGNTEESVKKMCYRYIKNKK